jgi:beta-N-acetylhexosaminidase
VNGASVCARLLCVGFDGHAVTPELREVIARGVRNVILFARNFVDRTQLAGLCREVKALAPPGESILVCVDHEGGRVQRFLTGFTHIPPMREVGRIAGEDELETAEHRARSLGHLIAGELRSCGIDLNLAPVLDVDSNPANPVIGERSFGRDPHLVARLGGAMIDALQSRGMAACGKHFPGHGDTSSDSHFHLPRLPQVEVAVA